MDIFHDIITAVRYYPGAVAICVGFPVALWLLFGGDGPGVGGSGSDCDGDGGGD